MGKPAYQRCLLEKSSKAHKNMTHKLADYSVPNAWYDPQSETDNRTTFEHDESAIIYSNPFKRMSNKSQIIVKPLRDHFRSRMVHTFEVREIAMAIGKALDLNTGLISAIALGHDLGHAPFGHAGERALQKIARREAETYLNISSSGSIPDRSWFHHASNSARILAIWLARSLAEREITPDTNRGVAEHSWSPWQPKDSNPTPRTYEAQAVAIADQLAGINHDTEDILNAYSYIGLRPKDLRRELTRLAPKRKKREIESLADQLIVDDENRAYGRKARIERSISEIVKKTTADFNDHKPSREDAPSRPSSVPDDFGAFLRCYEKAIRTIIHRETWFVGRDSMAEAIVTTVFNHFWPEVKNYAIDPTGELSFNPKNTEEPGKGLVTERCYLDHFHEFFLKHYIDQTERKYEIDKEMDVMKQLEVTTWTSFLYEQTMKKTKRKDKEDAKKKLTRLIAVIDFISGLTDRYCLEIFDATYERFLI